MYHQEGQVEDYGSLKSRGRYRSCSTKVSSGQFNIVVCTEMMLVTWMDHRKRQGLNVTSDDTKKAAMDCYNHLKGKETDPVHEFVTSLGWFYKLKTSYGFHNVNRSGEAKSADEDATLLLTYIVSGPSSRGGGGYKPQEVSE